MPTYKRAHRHTQHTRKRTYCALRVLISDCGRVRKKDKKKVEGEAADPAKQEEEKQAQPSAASAEKVCPDCGSALKYTKRLPHKGVVRFRCKSGCGYGVYLPDDSAAVAVQQQQQQPGTPTPKKQKDSKQAKRKLSEAEAAAASSSSSSSAKKQKKSKKARA